jgi:hypothetical protein
MTTLLEFATNDLARVTQDRTASGSALAAAQSTLQVRQKNRDDNAAAIARLQGDIVKKRLEIAAAAMPADAEAAAGELEQLLVQLNAAQAKAVDLQVELDTVQGQIDVQLDLLGAATTRSVSVAAAFAAAQKAEADHQAWQAASVATPVKDVSQTATDTIGGTLYAQAKARAEAGFDASLLAHVRKRETREQARLAAIETRRDGAQDDLDHKQAADRGIAGAVAPLRTTYERAEAAFREAVTGGQDRLNRALGLLASVAAAPTLPVAEKNHMLDATLVDPAKAQVANAEADEKARDDLATAQAKLERGQTEVSVGLTPFDTIANLQTAVVDANTAIGALVAFDESKLDAWEVTVPDSSWSLLAAFDEADLILNDLKTNSTPAKLSTLSTAMTTAANALAAKLEELAKSEHDIALLQARVKLQTELLDAAARNGSARVLNALRGDG